ncbi:MAG: hypothetical protein ACFE9L_01720 [Candidatus Hodarchaeota archaeon]
MVQDPITQDQLEFTLAFLNYQGVLFIRETSNAEKPNRESRKALEFL